MARNFLETEIEFNTEISTFNTFLKKAGSKSFPANKNGVISRNTESRDNKIRVLKSTPNTHKYKQYSIPA